jgi:hypothetical protein
MAAAENAADAAAAAADPFVSITLSALSPSPAAPLAQVHVLRAPGSAHPEPLDASPYSYQWTARHDGGALPEPSATGHYALALSALQEAKASMDLEFQRLLGKPAAAAGAAGEAGGGGGGAAAAAAAAGEGGACAEAASELERSEKKARLDAPAAAGMQ